MKKLLPSLLLILLTAGVCLSAGPRRTSAQVKKEQQANTQKIKQTRQEIEENKRKAEREYRALNSINAQIAEKKQAIAILQARIDSTARQIHVTEDSIAINTRKLEQLKENYGKSLRQARSTRQKMNGTALLFSSKSFFEASKRLGYLRQIDKSRNAKRQSLTERTRLLESQRQHLGQLRLQLDQRMSVLDEECRQLALRQAEAGEVVASLRNQAQALQQALDDRQKQAQALEAELNSVIEQEIREEQERQRREKEEAERRERERREAELLEQQRQEAERQRQEAERQQQEAANANSKDAKKKKKEEEKKRKEEEKKRKEEEKRRKNQKNKDKGKKTDTQTNKAPANTQSTTVANTATPSVQGSFAANKGRLPFPVSGRYSVVGTFGRSRHSDLQYIEIDNPGIDIETTAGNNAKAVFAGTVSSIFYMDGYHNIVMVRHGEYLTVYANIDNLMVKKGDTVTTGQALGRIFSDASDDGRTILHFEVRHEREKLNPMEWVK